MSRIKFPSGESGSTDVASGRRPNSHIKFRGKDGQIVVADIASARRSVVIKALLDYHGENWDEETIIPIPAITSEILRMIFEWLINCENFDNSETVDQWIIDFLNVSVKTLYYLMRAAHYFRLNDLKDLVNNRITFLTREKGPEEFARSVSLTGYSVRSEE